MAINRQQNWLGQQRVDVPHLRSIESGVAYDFDVAFGIAVAGELPVVVRGFQILPFGSFASATSLQLAVADSVIFHPTASESGTVLHVPADRAAETLNATNPRLIGSFTANTTNYIGIDFTRAPDADTADLVEFLDPDSKVEEGRRVPLARTLDYVIVVSAQDFDSMPGVAPLAKVVTNFANDVVSVEDARNSLYRLGSGGSVTDPYHAYSWPGGRTEATLNASFTAADKRIGSLKDWMDAAMTRMWELGGGDHWYSPTADRNVEMVRTGSTFTNGEWFEWTGTNLHWKGLKFVFDNSPGHENDVADQTSNLTGLTNLSDGDCIYVDLDRTQNLTGGSALTPVKAPLLTLGTPTIPGSRWIIAWRVGSTVYTRGSSFPVGATFFPATNTALGIVQLTYAAGNPSIPLVAPQDANGSMRNAATGGNGYGFRATGNGSGSGLEAFGGATGKGITAQGGTSGGAAITASGNTTANLDPLIQTFNSVGQYRTVFDANGLPGGHIYTREVNWDLKASGSTGYAATASTNLTDGTRTLSDWVVSSASSGGFYDFSVGTAKFLELIVGSATTAPIAEVGKYTVDFSLSNDFSAELVVATITTTGTEQHECGFVDETNFTASKTTKHTAGSGFFISFDPAAGPNWKFYAMNSGTATVVDSGVPVVANQGARVKFLYQAANSTLTCWVDGSGPKVITTHLPAGGLKFMARLNRPSGTGNNAALGVQPTTYSIGIVTASTYP